MDKAKVLNRVYASNLPSRAKTVMFYLVNRSNKELTCFPAIPTIAREVGLSERTVQRALKELSKEGYIEKSHRYRENGGQSSNLYILVVKKDDNNEAANAIEEASDAVVSGIGCIHTDMKRCRNEIENMYAPFSAAITPYIDCHRDGDNYVPP